MKGSCTMLAMAITYDDALTELYQAPLDAFVAERKRLAGELKASADPEGAARLAKVGRPTISVWVVNQLHYRAPKALDELLTSAEHLRAGNLSASGRHRDALAKLRARAAEILVEAGHAATDTTLRRVTTTLSALAAAGGFDPDPPGALSADRDPPGFGTFGEGVPEASGTSPAAPERAGASSGERREASAERAERARAEQQRRAEERARAEAEAEAARRLAERKRLEKALQRARDEVEARAAEVDRVKRELADVEEALEKARAVAEDVEARLARESKQK